MLNTCTATPISVLCWQRDWEYVCTKPGVMNKCCRSKNLINKWKTLQNIFGSRQEQMPKHTNFRLLVPALTVQLIWDLLVRNFLWFSKGFLHLRVLKVHKIRALKKCHCTARRVVNLSFFKDVIVVIDWEHMPRSHLGLVRKTWLNKKEQGKDKTWQKDTITNY